MRHWGDADVIEMWNREYAYPKIIPATQRDFFTHISTEFAAQIKTYRGDGGSYWEDEAGADARVAAMIRTSQTQLAAAEKFESIASWLQPHLKFDRQPFAAAWKNILLADSYVWSDANSFKRPESYRTRGGEAAHRAWADAALQQTTDLRLVAMDQIAELVGTDQQGTVVFNPESWPRSDFFDFELEPDEALTDPATGQTIPCGALRSLNGYKDVRCWASDVPATGYKFLCHNEGECSRGRTSRPRLFDTDDRHQILQSRPESTDRRSRALARQINGTGFGQLGLWLSIERIPLRKRWRPRRFQPHEQQDSCG